ncbi:MAG: ribonuclease Y [Eubacteriales bacterium]|nr:ribonuclease Y [bacterium]MDY2792432.1 ribonuclease Y [Eubacteriales bacterium]
MPTVLAIILILVALAAGVVAGFVYRQNVVEKKIGRTEEYANSLLADATHRAEEKKKEAILEAKEEVIRLKSELDKEVRDRRSEVTKQERRAQQREEMLDKKLDNLEVREENLNVKYKEAERLEAEAQELHDKQQGELERISNMTMEEARDILMTRIQKDAYHDAAVMVRDIESRAKEEGDKKARNIIAMAIQKCAADQVAETTVSVVALPNDDMKGRIIGREGRNIRALETATGVDLIIDDTPEAVIISGFDPVRREVARIALEKLIMDGRIHPARIEEMVEKARKEVDNQIREAGEQAIFETNLHGIHHELVRLLGRMKYRTSYGQNVLKHSIEVSHLAGVMAAELGADVQLAKRAGLLHDIGKSIDHEVEGTHVTIGAELAKKFHESDEVVHCIMAHHNDVEPTTVEAVLVQAADAISAARPGARRESIENYIKRLEKLEEIANSFEGVASSYAIQSGREVRIMVKPEDVNDAGTLILAKEIVKRIESEMEYPGQIKVSVIRETRSVEFAK